MLRCSMSSYSDTWKSIAQHVGRSEKWCRYTSKRPVDPLPVFKIGGIQRLDHADYDAWLERQKAAHRALSRVDSATRSRDSRDCSAAVDATPPLRVP